MSLPTTQKVPIYGAIAYFALAGDTVETVTVAKGTKPAGSDFSDWKTIGCIKDMKVTQENSTPGTTIDCFDPTTGKWETEETENTRAITKLIYDAEFQAVTAFVLQMSMAATSVGGADGAYVPGSQGGGAYQGWLKVQQQQGTDIVNVLDIWCELKLSEAAVVARKTPGYTPKLRAMQLEAAGNAGVLGTGW